MDLNFSAVRQAPNFAIQSGGQFPLGRGAGVFGEPPIMKRGEVRLNTANQVLVTLLRPGYTPKVGEFWQVEEVISGQCYDLLPSSLGEALTEMEVLAWAAR